MKFNKVIMNPPYKGNLYLKILKKVIKECKPEDDCKIINLSPCKILQKATFFDMNWPVKTEIKSVIEASDANKFFNINLGMNLGIYYIASTALNYTGIELSAEELLIKTIYDTKIKKMMCLDTAITKSSETDYSVKLYYGVTLEGHDRTYSILPSTTLTAFNKTTTKHNRFYNCKEADSQLNFYNCYRNPFFRVYVKVIGYGNIPYNKIPCFENIYWQGKSGIIDGYRNPITEEMLEEYFEVSDKLEFSKLSSKVLSTRGD